MAGRSEQEIREYSNLRGREADMLRMAQDAERMEVRLDREIAGDARVARMARKVLRDTPGDPAYFSTGIGADARTHVRLGLLRLELQAKRDGVLEEMVALATELPKMSPAGDKMLAAILKSNPQQALKAAPAVRAAGGGHAGKQASSKSEQAPQTGKSWSKVPPPKPWPKQSAENPDPGRQCNSCGKWHHEWHRELCQQGRVKKANYEKDGVGPSAGFGKKK
jgi:hypothetical protein